MPSVSIQSLLNAYNVIDFGADRFGNIDCGPAINNCLVQASQASPALGLVFLPPGLYRIVTSIVGQSNILLFGMGSATHLQLGPSAYVDLLTGSGISNFRVKDLRIDGNRANNSGQNGNGINFVNVTDAWIEDVELVSSVADGMMLAQCVRVNVRGGRVSDNGRHGVALHASEFCRFADVESYNNCQVSAAGVGDGFNLDVLSHHNRFLNCDGYETSLAGVLQGYGFREASGGGCYKNVWLGGPCEGNKTGRALVESDSLFSSYLELITGSWGIGTATPDASAMMDLVSTRLGFGLPALTTAQRDDIVSPRAGLAIFNSTTSKVNIRGASAWEEVTSA